MSVWESHQEAMEDQAKGTGDKNRNKARRLGIGQSIGIKKGGLCGTTKRETDLGKVQGSDDLP
jgi:hypothetical protein